MNEKMKNRKSNSLCVLVLDDPCTPENVEKFKKFLINGAEVNFRNSTLDFCTPLHIAVENESLDWTRLLIENGADKSITNQCGKSSLDIAIEKDLTEIVSLLRSEFNSGIKRIKEESIFKIDFKNREMLLQEASKTIDDPRKKVLKITNCTTANQAAQFMTETSFCKIFNDAPFLFIIIVHVETINVGDSDLLRYGLDSSFHKPMIIQITSPECSLLYFKESFGGKFKRLLIDDPTKLSDIECDIIEREHFSFEGLAMLLRKNSNIYGKFNHDLERTEVNVDQSIGGARLIDYAVEFDNILCLKFLQLFNFDLSVLNDNNTRTLEIAAERGTLAGIKILLDIPIDSAITLESLSPSQEQSELLNLSDQSGNSLLMIASASGQVEIIRFLIQCDLKVNHLNADKKNAFDVAFEKENFEALVELIKADGKFLRNFYGNFLDAENVKSANLNFLIQERNLFHTQIRNNQLEEIEKFVRDNPRIKCAYNSANKTALITALESGKLEVYSFLRSKGFSHGNDFTNYEFSHYLTDAQRRELRDYNEKNSKKLTMFTSWTFLRSLVRALAANKKTLRKSKFFTKFSMRLRNCSRS